MSNFTDIGKMRAKLDSRTGVIRITSGEKDSPLQKNAFVLNVKPGTKDHALITNMILEEEDGIENTKSNYKLPKIIHMSKNYRSADPTIIPLGITAEREIINWDTQNAAHLMVEGGTGTGKSELFRTIADHINTHQKNTQAYYFNTKQLDEISHINGVTGFSNLYENFHVNHSFEDNGLISHVYKLMMERYTYLEKNNKHSMHEEILEGAFKQTFLLIDGYHPIDIFKKQDNITKISAILRSGNAVGINVALSAQHFDFKILPNKKESSIPLKINTLGPNERSETGVSGEAQIRVFSELPQTIRIFCSR